MTETLNPCTLLARTSDNHHSLPHQRYFATDVSSLDLKSYNLQITTRHDCSVSKTSLNMVIKNMVIIKTNIYIYNDH